MDGGVEMFLGLEKGLSQKSSPGQPMNQCIVTMAKMTESKRIKGPLFMERTAGKM